MSRIHFIGGEKGGVGKSVVARLLAQRFIDGQVPFAALDGDLSSGALRRYYGEFTQPMDLGLNESADQIMDRALGSERRVLVDLPAQSVRSLVNWLTGANVFEFAREAGIGLCFWHVTDGGFASVSELERGLSLLGGQARHVVVKNHGRSKDFSQFEHSEAKRLLDEHGGQVLELPELDSAVMYAIDRFGSSFWAAINRGDGEHALRPLDRQRARLWLERCYAALAPLEAVL